MVSYWTQVIYSYAVSVSHFQNQIFLYGELLWLILTLYTPRGDI